MIALGNKIGNRYARYKAGFTEPIEFGISLSLGDHKFLDSYIASTVDGTYEPSDQYLTINDSEDYREKYPSYAIYNFDVKIVPSAYIGPSTSASGNSKGVIQIRPIWAFDQDELWIGTDINSSADTLRMYLSDNDPIILPNLPIDWKSYAKHFVSDEFDPCLPMVPRMPKMINVPNHSNSLLINTDFFNHTNILELHSPITGIINPAFNYRYSFYYRAKKAYETDGCTISPRVEYYKAGAVDGDIPILTSNYPTESLTTDINYNENTDFKLFQLAIPRIGNSIPNNTRRIRIVLKFSNTYVGETNITYIDYCYPVLENAMGIETGQGYIFIPYSPSSFSYREISPTKKSRSFINTPIVFDTTRLFRNHPGRRLYEVSMSFSIANSTYVYQLRHLENMNKMGHKIAFRPKHPDLPPVLIGDLDVRVTNPSYDFNINDIEINFVETD